VAAKSAVDISYDADMQVLRVDVRSDTYYQEGRDGADRGILLRSDAIPAGTYVGSNAFGVKKTITRVKFAEYGVLLPVDDPIFIQHPFEDQAETSARFLIRAAPTTAVTLKTTLRAALVCAIAYPAVLEETSRHKPTIAAPYETNTLRQFIPVVIRELILFDEITGKVIARRAPDSWRTQSPSTFDLRPDPYRMKVVVTGMGNMEVSVDGGDPRSTAYGPPGVIYARERITVSVSSEFEMGRVTFLLNDKPFEPLWKVNRMKYGIFEAASVDIVPADANASGR
jgi:hypothetical protein